MLLLLLMCCVLCPIILQSCVLLPDDAKPKGLEERAIDSEIVLAAYTRTVYKSKNNTTSYSAEFLVFNILKGEPQVLEIYKQRKPSSLEMALNRRLVNATNFGDPTKCHSEVNPGETYILFFDVTADGQLTARYDGVYGPAVLYSRDKELALEAIGSSPWSEWSPCSGSCGGGIQQRRRQCEESSKCTNEEGQQRTCNMFSCSGTLNALEAANVHRSSLRPASRPTAYKLLPSGTWRSKEEEIIFPRTFPWEFSLLVTVRVKQTSSGGFLLRVLHSGSLQVGLYISDTITLVLSDKDNVRVSFVKSLFDDHWNQIAFSVRRNTVSFYVNCEFNGKLPLPGKIRPFGFQPATVIVGSTGPQELDAFQGDIDQIVITGSPDDGEKQCNSTTQPLQYRAEFLHSRQEVKARPLPNHGTQNDQLPLRGNTIDDEDFAFEENGSGNKATTSGDEYDEDYEDDDEKGTTATSTPKEKEKIPLKAEKPEDDDSAVSDEDEDEDDDERDDSDDKDNEIDNNYDRDDDEEKDIYDKKSTDAKKDKNEEVKSDIDDRSDIASNKIKEDTVHSKEKVVHNADNKENGNVDTIKKSHEKSDSKHKEADKNNVLDEFSKDNELEQQNTDFKEKQIVTENSLGKKDENENNLNHKNFEDTKPGVIEDTIYRDDYDYNHPDEEIDKEDESIGGSGDGSSLALAWSEWSPCSSSCNWGRRTRTSYCVDNGRNLDSCGLASLKRSETEACFSGLCPTTSTTTSTTTTPQPSTTTQNINSVHNKSVATSLFDIKPIKACKVKCLNGGTCHPPYKCRCLPGFYGNMCQYAMCKPHCLNGGTCIALNKCRCKSGFAGTYCHKAICERGCRNGGECVSPNKCACRSGFTGIDCGEPLCDPMCQNGGKCIKPYFCHCPIGTKGAFCEKFSCKPECQNGGTCISPGQCSCPKGYFGNNCEQIFCPGGCLNGGICGKTGKCFCPSGYSGLQCEIRKPCKFKEIKEPYTRGFKQKVATHVKVPCGAWGWKMCTKTKVHYETVYKTFFKTSYECEGPKSKYPDFQKYKSV